MAIIKISGLSAAAVMKAKGNLADAAARQTALNSQIMQSWECSFLLIEKKKEKKKGKHTSLL